MSGAIGINTSNKSGAIGINIEDDAVRRRKEQLQAPPVTVFQPRAYNTGAVNNLNSVFKTTNSAAAGM